MSNAQHRHHSHSQSANLDLVTQKSQEKYSGYHGAAFPISAARTLPFIDGPMAPALAAIEIAALHHAAIGDPETESTLLALGLAMTRVETELPYEPKTKDPENTKEESEGPSCSKIPIVELLFHETQRVDRDHLRLLLRYVGEVVKAFEKELDVKDQETADAAGLETETETEVGFMLPRNIRGQRQRSSIPEKWKEPESIAKNFPGLD
ncbi:hypothetical protein BUE80_DR003598 [Diplocarpon rosae]|nr:hypothetical protein BUE80_DR003598 [Diplocarpon rosae]